MLGATALMRDSTNASICCLLSDSPSTCSHCSVTAACVWSGSGVPTVVDAVTVTTITVADGRMPVRSTCAAVGGNGCTRVAAQQGLGSAL